MAAQPGKNLLIKIGDGEVSEAFTTVAGLRTKRLSFNEETVDITHSETTGRWRALLAGAGVRSAEVSGDGVFTDDATAEEVRAAFFAGTIPNWEILLPDFGTISGAFQITSLEFSGEYNGEMVYSLTLASAGEITWAAAT